MRRAVALGTLVALTLLAGCVDYTASEIPDGKLDGGTGNGWILDHYEPADGPEERNFGLVKSRTAVYRDPADDGGYPASLSIISVKVAFQDPDQDELTDRARRQVKEAAEDLGVDLETPPEKGTRTVKSGDEARYFLYNGTVEEDSDLFAREADVKVVGMVWTCGEGGENTIVAVGLAQVNERTQGVIEDPDPRNWQEMWIDSDLDDRGSDGGLIVHATCG